MKRDYAEGIGVVILSGLAVAAFAAMVVLLMAGPLYLAWNFAAVPVFDVRPVTFWQAFGLAILFRLVFGGGGSSEAKKS